MPNFDEILGKIIHFHEFKQYLPGQCIYHYGSIADKIYFIIKGKVAEFVMKDDKCIENDLEIAKKLEDS